MSTSWTRTASQICRDALEHLGALGANETPSAEDQSKALRALDAVLKELPLSGYVWPKLSGEVSLTWSAGTPQTIALPADYFDYPVAWATVSGQAKRLTQIPHATWVSMTDQATTAEQPTHFYISPDKTLYFWPIPAADPIAKLQYMRIVSDASATAAPDVLQTMLNALGWGVANEMSLDFGLSQADRVEISQRWESKKALAIGASTAHEPIVISVAD